MIIYSCAFIFLVFIILHACAERKFIDKNRNTSERARIAFWSSVFMGCAIFLPVLAIIAYDLVNK